MNKFIDNALLEQFNDSISLYVDDDDVKIDEVKAAIIALLTNYHSRMEDINFLIKAHRLNSANVLIRVAFETSVYLKYIFEKNSRIKSRAKAYYFHDFQKLSYYLQNLDKTNIVKSIDIIDDMNNKIEAQVLGPYKSVNSYFNGMRSKFKNCFAIENKNLSFKLLKDNDEFTKSKIDSWKWYNDDGNTDTFLKLVCRLNLLDEYAALYAPTSDNIHSDGLQHQLKFSQHQIIVQESLDTPLLVYFNSSILEFIKILGKHIHNSNKRLEISKNLKRARAIYSINND